MIIRTFKALIIASGIICIQNIEAGETAERLSFVSLQSILSNPAEHLDKRVMVTAYLSDNCPSVCLFAYRDDALVFNSPNSLKIVSDADGARSMLDACGEGYVSVVGIVRELEGFGNASLANIESIRTKSLQNEASEYCWRPE